MPAALKLTGVSKRGGLTALRDAMSPNQNATGFIVLNNIPVAVVAMIVFLGNASAHIVGALRQVKLLSSQIRLPSSDQKTGTQPLQPD